MLNLLTKLKFAWQRATRGYDDTFMWEMDAYLEHYFLPAIKEFCKRETEDERFKKVYDEMLKKIKEFEEMDIEDYYKIDNARDKMWEYFGKNIGYFWY